ncbi:MAG TPA: hypothetical protein PLQ11_08695 [Beijerinckiaceae bacterium]|nr:hypothetical protein [Beijerinckiaceae bacterium]
MIGGIPARFVTDARIGGRHQLIRGAMTSYTREIIEILKQNGFEFYRSGKGDHQI